MNEQTENNTGILPATDGLKLLLAKTALVSCGLSHVHRGYEAFIAGLFEALADVGAVSLLTGSGYPLKDNCLTSVQGAVQTLPGLPRNHLLSKALFSHEEERYTAEQYSMALGGLLAGQWQRYQLLYVCDPNLGRALYQFKRRLGLNYKMIFANCGPQNPADVAVFDHIQEFTPAYYQRALDAGIPADHLSMIPMGIWPEHYTCGSETHFSQSCDSRLCRVPKNRAALRQKWAIPEDARVALSVASVDESFKRLDFLIETLASMADPNLYLILLGQNQQTPTAKRTLALADEKLAGRYQQRTVSAQAVSEFYTASDLFVLPSLQEGFGKVYLEAMASGLPVLAHDNPHTRWILKSDASRMDMTDASALARGIQSVLNTPQCAEAMVTENRDYLNATFHWNNLLPHYLAMFAQVSGALR